MLLTHDDLVARLDPLLRIKRLDYSTFPLDSAGHRRILEAAYADTRGRVRLHGRPIVNERQAYSVARKLYLQAQQVVEHNDLERLATEARRHGTQLTATILDVAFNDEHPADRLITYRVATKASETTHVFDGWFETALLSATDRQRLTNELRRIAAWIGMPIDLRHPDEENL